MKSFRGKLVELADRANYEKATSKYEYSLKLYNIILNDTIFSSSCEQAAYEGYYDVELNLLVPLFKIISYDSNPYCFSFEYHEVRDALRMKGFEVPEEGTLEKLRVSWAPKENE